MASSLAIAYPPFPGQAIDFESPLTAPSPPPLPPLTAFDLPPPAPREASAFVPANQRNNAHHASPHVITLQPSPASQSHGSSGSSKGNPSRPLAVSPLSYIPHDIAIHRERLFALDGPVELAPSIWERFWPFIDNVWCIHQRPNAASGTGISKVYGACRLGRKSNFPMPVLKEGSRPRQRREGGTCSAKFKLTLYPDGRRIVERTGEPHSHSLEHIDSVKRNSGVRSLVLSDFFKSWEAGGILAFLRDNPAATNPDPTLSYDVNPDILRQAGGLFLSRQEVQNILNSASRKAYPDQDISEVKRQMDKYKNYTTCNFKGCDAPAFSDPKALMEHRKSVHGLRNHDHSNKIWKCTEKGCWRRKKSKGFNTLLALEEHLKEKHGKDTDGLVPAKSAGCRNVEGGNVIGEMDVTGSDDSPLGEEFSIPPTPGLNMGMGMSVDINLNMNMSNSIMGSAMSNPGITNAPVTPESSTDNPPLSQNQDTPGTAGAHDAMRALSQMEKENMKARIKKLEFEKKRLEIETHRISAEIGRLKAAVHRDYEGHGPHPVTENVGG